MRMGIDQPGMDQLAGSVDDGCVRGGGKTMQADLADRLALGQEVERLSLRLSGPAAAQGKKTRSATTMSHELYQMRCGSSSD